MNRQSDEEIQRPEWKWKLLSCVWLFATLWSSPGQNTGAGSLLLLQGIFPTTGLNPGLWHCRQILYQLSHKGCPRILEWVAYFFSSRFSPPRNWTGVSLHCWRRKWQPTPVFLSEESWTEEPGRLQTMGLQRVRPDWMTNNNSCTASRFFTNWAIREARCLFYLSIKSLIEIKNCVKVLGFSETLTWQAFFFSFSLDEYFWKWVNVTMM